MGNLRRVKKQLIPMSMKSKRRFIKNNPLFNIQIITTEKKQNAEDNTNQKLSVQ